VFRIDKRGDSALALRIGNSMQRQRGFTGRFRAIDFHDAPARQSADAESDVQGNGTGGNGFDRRTGVIAEAHDRALAKLLINLCKRCFQSLLAVSWCGHSSPRYLGARQGHVHFSL
jgi:hypothetical protein